MKRNPILIALSIGAILFSLISLFILDEFVFQKNGHLPHPKIDLDEYRISTAKSYEIYRQWTISENKRIFDWHLRSTKIIFWVSILVAIIGFGFSFWQFVEASNHVQKATDTEQMKLKTKLISLAFKSRSIAALIMFISVAYLLIYVILVYPIRNIPQSPLPENQMQYSQDISLKVNKGEVSRKMKFNVNQEINKHKEISQ